MREARLNARTKADVSALQALIAQVNSLDLSGYTDSSKLTLDRALIAAKRVAADEEAAQDEVNLMLEQLQVEPVQESQAPQTDADKEGTAPANDDAEARGADSG